MSKGKPGFNERGRPSDIAEMLKCMDKQRKLSFNERRRLSDKLSL